ncbi:hypothetical protein RAA17_09400 [Komagataeibacter rhaeticus]|nr:hypothetical protein [Komagataeibacter rhaeticus]
MQLMGIANAAPEPRLHTMQMTGHNDSAVQATLDSADALVACLGYRPRRVAIMDRDNHPMALATDHPDGSLTGPDCGIMDGSGHEIPGLFGLGLASGYSASATMGGESSFNGQVNSLWLWQNAIGEKILYQLLPEEAPCPVSQWPMPPQSTRITVSITDPGWCVSSCPQAALPPAGRPAYGKIHQSYRSL